MNTHTHTANCKTDNEKTEIKSSNLQYMELCFYTGGNRKYSIWLISKKLDQTEAKILKVWHKVMRERAREGLDVHMLSISCFYFISF